MVTGVKKNLSLRIILAIAVVAAMTVALAACGVIKGSADTKTSYLEYAELEEDSRIQSNEFVSAFYTNIYVRESGDDLILIIPDLSSIYSNHRDEIADGDLYDVMIENMAESTVEVDYSEDAILEVVNDFVDLAVQDLDSVDVSVDLVMPES